MVVGVRLWWLHVRNQVPSRGNKVISYELWKKRKSTLSYLRVWGCRAIVRMPEPKVKKLREKGIECIFLGYAELSKEYMFLVVEPNISIYVNFIFESLDVVFYENIFSTYLKPYILKFLVVLLLLRRSKIMNQFFMQIWCWSSWIKDK